MATQLPQVSVTAPVSPALERVQEMLFRPFDLRKWFVLGFAAWLARLGRSGFSGFNGGRLPGNRPLFHGGKVSTDPATLDAWLAHARGWAMQNLYWVLPLAVAVAGLLLALGVLCIWLSSRGELVFLHCVALDRAEIAVPWRRYAREARSLFLFRLVLGLIALTGVILILATAGVAALRMIRRGGFAPADVLPLALAGLAFAVLAVGVLAVAKLTSDLVVPIMFRRGVTCRAGWAELLHLFAGRAGALILYLLFQVVLALAIGVLVLVAVIATCCLAGCLLLLPYLGTVVLLPVLVFQRAYSLFYLRQLGAPYDLFQAAAAPVAPIGS